MLLHTFPGHGDFLEPIENLTALTALCRFTCERRQGGRVTYCWPSGQSPWPELKPSKEVVSGKFLFVHDTEKSHSGL